MDAEEEAPVKAQSALREPAATESLEAANQSGDNTEAVPATTTDVALEQDA